MAELFIRDEWLAQLSYLADIFSELNELNLKLQGKENDIFKHTEEVQAFKKSLKIWQARVKTDQPVYYMFPTLLRHIEENHLNQECMQKIKKDIDLHLQSLSASFEQYFPEEKTIHLKEKYWVKDPFVFGNPDSVVELNLTPSKEEVSPAN